MKTSELSGAALDWAVAKCEGGYNIDSTGRPWDVDASDPTDEEAGTVWFCPSTNWSQGGPIIEREGIYLKSNDHANKWASGALSKNRHDKLPGHLYFGSSPLIAAMRCYVASKLGEEVEIPDHLLDK